MRTFTCLLCLVGGQGFVPSVSPAPSACTFSLLRNQNVWRADLPRMNDVLLEDLTEMPARWKQVPECERPLRWRTALGDQTCGSTEETAATVVHSESTKETHAQTGIVGSLTNADEVLAACERSRAQNSLVVLKLYSRRCPACQRIAPKFEKLAKNYKGSIDFYEVEIKAARPLVELLDVHALPTIVLIDPEGMVRVGSCPCAPASFKAAEAKVKSAMYCLKKRRALLRRLGRRIGDEMRAIRWI